MKKHFAFCPTHDWEGMFRNDKEEAEKDLVAHKELFPNEIHEGASIKTTVEEEKNIASPEAGSTHANCDRNSCKWHRNVNRFEIGKKGAYVKVKALPEFGIFMDYVKLKNLTGGEDIEFQKDEITFKEGRKFALEGKYQIIPSYYAPDPVTNYKVTIFVRW